MSTLIAQITNPAVPILSSASGDSGQIGASILGRYLGILIPTAITVGGLAVLVYMIIGSIQWITAGGDKGKIEKARERIVQAIVGLGLLVSVVAIANFIGPIFGFDLLRLNFINQITPSSGATRMVAPVASKAPAATTPPAASSGGFFSSLFDALGF